MNAARESCFGRWDSAMTLGAAQADYQLLSLSTLQAAETPFAPAQDRRGPTTRAAAFRVMERPPFSSPGCQSC